MSIFSPLWKTPLTRDNIKTMITRRKFTPNDIAELKNAPNSFFNFYDKRTGLKILFKRFLTSPYQIEKLLKEYSLGWWRN